MRRSGVGALVVVAAVAYATAGCGASCPEAAGSRGSGAATAAAARQQSPAPVEPASKNQPDLEAARADAGGSAKPAEPEPPPIPPNTAVLHVGDSFVLAGFSQALKPRMKELRVRYEVRSEQSSYTVTWASKIELLVQNTQPDLVIITLGANEVSNSRPEAHAPAVRRIVKLIGGRPCVWVTPPMWKKDTGILDVIRQNVAPCRLFDSDVLVGEPVARQPDKIHPSREGGATWASAFWTWLQAQRLPKGDAEKPWALRPAPPEEYERSRAEQTFARDANRR